MHARHTPKTIFVRLALQWAVFELCPFSEKYTEWPQNYIDMFKVIYAYYLHSYLSPNFHPFCSKMSCFWVKSLFSEKCTEWPQMTLACSRSKINNMHATYTPVAKSFVSFTLPWAVCGPNIGKGAPNDPKMTLTCLRSKVHICIQHTSPAPKFPSVSLYDEPFSRKLRRFNSQLVTM